MLTLNLLSYFIKIFLKVFIIVSKMPVLYSFITDEILMESNVFTAVKICLKLYNGHLICWVFFHTSFSLLTGTKFFCLFVFFKESRKMFLNCFCIFIET